MIILYDNFLCLNELDTLCTVTYKAMELLNNCMMMGFITELYSVECLLHAFYLTLKCALALVAQMRDFILPLLIAIFTEKYFVFSKSHLKMGF